MKTRITPSPRQKQQAGMTLAETLIAVSIATITISGTVDGYLLSANRAEWSAQSLAAHSMAMQRLEQVRSAKWDTAAYPQVDRVVPANFPGVTNVLDIPISGTNVVTARVITTISTVSTAPPLKLIRVDTIWPYMNHGWFTNTVMSYRAPDQ